MKKIFTLLTIFIAVVSFNKSYACDDCTFNIDAETINPDGTTTYVLSGTIEIGGFDPSYYGSVFEFTNGCGKPISIVSYSPDMDGRVTGLDGSDVKSLTNDNDWNVFDNRTDVVSYESSGTAASVDFNFSISITVSGIVNNIILWSNPNSTSSSCRYPRTTLTSGCCDASFTPVDICETETGTIDVSTWATEAGGVWSATPSTALSGSNLDLSFLGVSGSVDLTYTVSTDGGCNRTRTISAIPFTNPTGLASSYNVCNIDQVLNAQIGAVFPPCQYSYRLNDSWGDGWKEGHNIDFASGDGSVVINENLPSGSNKYGSFTIQPGDNLTVTFNRVGNYSNEATWYLHEYDASASNNLGTQLYVEGRNDGSGPQEPTTSPIVFTCPGDPNTYSWSPTTGFVPPSVSSDAAPTVNVSTNTTYNVTITDGSNGCIKTFSTSIDGCCAADPGVWN